MKQKIDFILNENLHLGERDIFRFYPRQSVFYLDNDDESEVLGDYCYSIISQTRDNENSNWESDVKFSSECDEDSAIYAVGMVCMDIANGIYEGRRINSRGGFDYYSYFDCEFHSFGECVTWIIHKGEDFGKVYYELSFWRYDNVGYRFSLEEDQMEAFGQYLVDCNEYMENHPKFVE